MVSRKEKDGAFINEQLTKLQAQGRIAYDIRVANTLQCRWQWGQFPSGVFFLHRQTQKKWGVTMTLQVRQEYATPQITPLLQ